MGERENIEGVDVSNLLREMVLSGEGENGLEFWDELEKYKDVPFLSIKISASELPKGRERIICNFLKSFISTGDRVTRQAVITGTQEEYNFLENLACGNAFASGVDFEIVE